MDLQTKCDGFEDETFEKCIKKKKRRYIKSSKQKNRSSREKDEKERK